jgi:hypothetical protein
MMHAGRELQHCLVMLDADNNLRLSRREFEEGLKECRWAPLAAA